MSRKGKPFLLALSEDRRSPETIYGFRKKSSQRRLDVHRGISIFPGNLCSLT
jgi:hypothetical protein